MKNKFTERLIEIGWEEIRSMNFLFKKNNEFTLFFSSSSYIELYQNNQFKDEKYCKEVDDLDSFLKKNGLF